MTDDNMLDPPPSALDDIEADIVKLNLNDEDALYIWKTGIEIYNNMKYYENLLLKNSNCDQK